MADTDKKKLDVRPDGKHEGRDSYFIDEDRMVNEGLGGGNVTRDNGLIEFSSTDTMLHPDSVLEQINRSFNRVEMDDADHVEDEG